MSKNLRVGYQYPASRLRLIRKRWTVIVSIPAHLRHLYSNQRDKRKSTFTSDKSVADRLHHALAQQIYDEFDAKQNEHPSVCRQHSWVQIAVFDKRVFLAHRNH